MAFDHCLLVDVISNAKDAKILFDEQYSSRDNHSPIYTVFVHHDPGSRHACLPLKKE
jgi:hypothetical protein